MTVNDVQRGSSAVPRTTKTGNPIADHSKNQALASAPKLLRELFSEWRGAIDDHRQWINSDRARALGTTFKVSGRLLAYAAYIALGYLIYRGYVDIRSGLSSGIYPAPVHNMGSRVALFNILAAGLVGPLVIGLIVFVIGWLYKLTTAASNNVLPRFLHAWIHPSIMFVVVAAFVVFHSAATGTAAKGWLHANANIDAGFLHEVADRKATDMPGPEAQAVPEVAIPSSAGDRELQRLRSMFHTDRPCPDVVQREETNSQAEPVRPEPGMPVGRDCPVAGHASHVKN